MGARWRRRSGNSGLMATGMVQAEHDEGQKFVYERIRMRDVATDINGIESLSLNLFGLSRLCSRVLYKVGILGIIRSRSSEPCLGGSSHQDMRGPSHSRGILGDTDTLTRPWRL